MARRETIPKGSMCAVCNNKDNNCSHLDFKSMQVIEKTKEYNIVRCTFFTTGKKK